MKKFLPLICALLALAPAHAAPPPGYHLGWSDEFNGAGIDSSKWNWGSLPWGGQHHTDAYSSYITAADSYLQNGSLVLRCRQGDFGGYPWSEGFVHSNGKYRFTYGYVEVRARFPVAKGTWPAFWTLSDGWPPEFDIAEYFGDDNRMHMGFAYGTCCPVNWNSSNLYNEDFGNWHTYGLEWGPGFAKWYRDGTVRKTITESYVTSQSQYIILNSGMTYGFDGSTPNPNYTEFDYCRVFLGGASTPPTITDLGSRTTPTNTPTPPLPFTIDDAETPLNLLILSATSGNTTLVPNANIVLGGSGANRTVTVTPAPGLGGTAGITVSVSDGEFTVNETFNVIVSGTNSAPFISPLANLTVEAGNAIGGRQFTVSDPETPAAALTLTATTSNPDLIPLTNIVFVGSGSNRTITVKPRPGLTGESDIDVIVNDGALTAHDLLRVTVINPKNLVDSPGFEEGLANWVRVFGGTVGTTAGPVHGGDAAGELTGRTEWYHGLGASLSNKLTSGVTYRCSVWVRLSGATSDDARLTMRVIDGSGTHYYSAADAQAGSGAWTRLAGDVTPVFIGTVTSVVLYAEGPASGVDLLVDDMSVVPRDPNVLVPPGAVWRYRDNGSAPPANWTAVSFNDSAWTNGPAQLGYGDGDEARTISFGPSPANKYITTWFRHAFTLTNPWAWTDLRLRLLRDDGAAVYLNGTEVLRDNLPAGPLSATTPATAAVTGADEDRFLSAAVAPSLLLPGTNVLAVEIHQEATNSSDISFDLELTGTTPAPVPLVPAGSLWRYNATGANLGAAWRATGFNDSAWPEGFAQLGFGDGDEATLVANNQQITTYFRHTLALSDAAGYHQFGLRLRRDDGAAVYVNGTEVFRSNLTNNQPIAYNTLATNATDDGAAWLSARVNAALFVSGTNTLAVEVHQTSAASSDVSFDFELVGYPPSALPALNATTGGALTLSWSAWAAGYRLESSASLAPPAAWTPVTNSVALSSGQFVATLPAPGAGPRFFRLRQ